MSSSMIRRAACVIALTASQGSAQQPSRVAAPAPPPGATRVGYINGVTVNEGMVSPDGRWVVVSGWDTKQDAIWVLPAQGGEPRRLLQGPLDSRPTFSPAGDRIIFGSSRVDRGTNPSDRYIVSVPFDTETGTLRGEVRQIGLQPASILTPLVSPDGRWVAYNTIARELRIVPLQGGTERVLGKIEPFGMPARTLSWTADSRALEWNDTEPGRPSPRRYRASIDATSPTVIAEATPIRGALMPDGRHAAVMRVGGPSRFLAIIDLNGAVVAEVPMPDLVRAQVSHNGRYLVAFSRNQEAALRAVSTNGGASRVVVPADDQYLWPEAWTADGELVYSDRTKWSVASMSGRKSGAIQLSAFGPRAVLHRLIGDHAVVGVPDTTAVALQTLHLLELSSGRHQQVAERALVDDVRGAGGRYNVDGDRFLFATREASAAQISSFDARGNVQVIGRLRNAPLAPAGFGVHGRRLAYLELQRDTVWLMLSDAPEATPRRVVGVPGNSAQAELAWSNDGSRIAISGSDTDRLHIVSLGDQQKPATLRTLTLPLNYYYEIFWVAGDRSVTVVTEPKDGSGANIARIDIDTGRTTILTADDPNPRLGTPGEP